MYKPPGSLDSGERYPVIYMQDGQNLFDQFIAFGSEWQVDETLDAEAARIIVIGIENGAEHRMQEYMVHDHPEYGMAQGELYLRDLTETLKPYVDQVLPTLPDAGHTCICGSSMGGLISLYAGLDFPHIYGSVAVLSPSLWLDTPRILEEAGKASGNNAVQPGTVPSQRWYFYAGGRESETMIDEVASLVSVMRQNPMFEVSYQFDAAGIHDEAVWRNYFPNLYKWFIGRKPAAELEQESDIIIE